MRVLGSSPPPSQQAAATTRVTWLESCIKALWLGIQQETAVWLVILVALTLESASLFADSGRQVSEHSNFWNRTCLTVSHLMSLASHETFTQQDPTLKMKYRASENAFPEPPVCCCNLTVDCSQGKLVLEWVNLEDATVALG